jgi:hypothetical protein
MKKTKEAFGNYSIVKSVFEFKRRKIKYAFFKEMITKRLPDLEKDVNIQLYERQRSPIKFNPKRNLLRHSNNQTTKNQR